MLVARATGPDQALAEDVLDAIAPALEAQGLDPRRPPRPEPAPTPRDLESELAAATEAYAHLRLEEARTTLDASIATLEATGGADLEPATLVRVRVLAAEIARAMGDEGATERALDLALAIDPALVLDPALEPPPLLLTLDARRRALETCDLTIRVRPADATVILDGTARATGSLTLPCGTHLLRVEAEGRTTSARALVLRPGEPSTLDLTLAIDAPEVLANPGPPFTAIALELTEAAESLGGALLVLDVERTRDGRARARLVGLDHDAQVTAASDGAAIASALLGPDEVPAAATVDPWPWVGLGIGVLALVGVAIGLGVGLSESTAGSFGIHGSILP